MTKRPARSKARPVDARRQPPVSPLVDLGRRTIDPAWINATGHLRAAEYVVVFEDAIGSFLDRIGCSAKDIRRTGTAPVLAEMHVLYRRELRAGETVAVSLQVLGLSERSAHVFLRMAETGSNELAASVELVIVNLALDGRKPAAWSASQLAVLRVLAEAHAVLPRPTEAGRGIGR
jgi:acyl-CoA thioesterase FadM